MSIMLGNGIDIEETDRFKNRLQDKNFLNKIFTERELRYAFSQSNPEQHLAARFAAKEAIKKAHHKFVLTEFADIEILNGKNGKPKVIVHSSSKDGLEIMISMGHTKAFGYAQCVVITTHDSERN